MIKKVKPTSYRGITRNLVHIAHPSKPDMTICNKTIRPDWKDVDSGVATGCYGCRRAARMLSLDS